MVHDPNRGFWIFPDGEEEPIRDHYNAVRVNPEKYGLSESDMITGESVDKAREKVLPLVMQKGYIRVRGQGDYTLMTYWRMTTKIALNIRKFIAYHKYRDKDRILLSDLSTKKSNYVTVRHIFTDHFLTAAKSNETWFKDSKTTKHEIKRTQER